MNIEEQILKLSDFSIVFLSKTCFVVTRDLEKTLKFEKIIPIYSELRVKKSRSSVGLKEFNVKVKGDIVNVFINDKRVNLKDLINNSLFFDDVNLLSNSKYISYKKGDNIYVVLPKEDYTYLSRGNVIQKRDLGNVIYFRDKTKEEFLKIQNFLTEFNVPFSRYIFDNKLSEEDIDNVTYANDLSPNNAFYFINDNSVKISNTGAKQIITYGFSRNNSLNYFDVDMSSNFLELKNYIDSNFNYNKNYFTNVDKHITNVEVVLRRMQFDIFLPVSFHDVKDMSCIPLVGGNIFFNASLKYLTLREMLKPFLYSVFKEQRIHNISPYFNKNNQIIFNKYLLYVPIFSFVDDLIKQKLVKIYFDDIFYDFETGEKFSCDTSQFFSISEMPIYVKCGGIIPLNLNVGSTEEEYEIRIYPGGDNEYILHYDEYVLNSVVTHAYSTLNLECTKTKIRFDIKSNSAKDYIPKRIILKFINLKSSCDIKIIGASHTLDYNIENKQLIIKIEEISDDVKLIISNDLGVELDRCSEFYYKKLDLFFDKMGCDDTDYELYKYKIRPYLHESIELIESRMLKHIKFLSKKHIKSLINLLSFYKK